MASGTVMPVPQIQFLDGNGKPYSLGTLDCFEAGTTTRLDSFSDSALSSANANPVVLDSAGRATVYLKPQSYKFVLKDSSGVTIYTQDNIFALQAAASVNVELTGTAGEAVVANNLLYLSDGSNSKTSGRWFKADADFVYASTEPELGFATGTIASGATGLIRIAGSMDGFSGLTEGANYYVSATAASITSTEPSNSREIGVPMSSTEIAIGFGPTSTSVPPAVTKRADGRLSLTTDVPVTTADVTAAGTIYYVPYVGDKIGLYNGASWKDHTFTELSLALTATDAKNYDVFIYDNSGTLTLETLIWTNDTTRSGGGLAFQNGILCKSGALTRRYVGTFRASATDDTEDSYAKRFVWNMYNRVSRPMRVVDTTNSWTYTTATIRQANGSTANQVALVNGYAGDGIFVQVLHHVSNDGGGRQMWAYVGEDATNAKATGSSASQRRSASNSTQPITATLASIPGVGYRYYAWLESSQASGTTTWYGDNGGDGRMSGISALWRA